MSPLPSPTADAVRLPARPLVPGVRTHLRNAVAALPDAQRRALIMWRFEGKAYEEIARALGTSVQSAKALLWRARESLGLAVDTHVAQRPA